MSKIFLNPGHGGEDPGASANGLVEKDVNLVTMLECKKILECHGLEVFCSRIKDENDSSREVVKKIEDVEPDLVVSFHANAGGGDGFEVYVNPLDLEAVRLANLCETRVLELGQNSRGIKNGNWLYIIKKATVPTVIVESFFLDNENDKLIGDTIEEQRQFGTAYAKAILDYLGIEYGSINVEKQENEIEDGEADKLYRVQVGAFSKKENADRLKAELERLGYDVIIV